MQSFESVPTWFSDYLGITLGAAQIILSIVVILAVVLPVMFLSRGSKSMTIEIVSLFLAMCFLVGIGWLPFWILITTVAVLALEVSSFGTKVIVGD